MYPKAITIENDKLKNLLEKKSELIMKGRGVSEEIEKLETEMAEIDKQIQDEEKKVDVTDLDEKAKVLIEKVNEAIKEMDEIKKEIYDRMMNQVPPELHTKYDELNKAKEEKDLERNKIALKAQKYNDKIIPISREMMQPFLEDIYEDYDTLYLEDGEIVATIFSHLDDFKKNFKRKQ
jgi:seryl-tRNA synthetase